MNSSFSSNNENIAPCSSSSNAAAPMPSAFSMVDEDYFCLEGIAASNTTITCIFEPDTPLVIFRILGQKAPESIGANGLRVNVPTWMVPALEHVATMSTPSVYAAVNRAVIHAGAQVTNFEQLQRHFYTLGVYICRLTLGEESRQIALALLAAFTQRIGHILRQAVNTGAKPTRLDETERRIFFEVQNMERRKEEWFFNRTEDDRNRRSVKRRHGEGDNQPKN